MIKKISFVLISIAFITGLVYIYFNFKEIKRPISNAINAIPSSAAIILENKNLSKTWNSLSQSNIIWEELSKTNYINGLDKNLQFLDSLYHHYPKAKQFLDKNSIFVSAHLSGASNFNFLFTFSLPPTFDNVFIQTIFENFSNSGIKSRQYDESTIFTSTDTKNKVSFSYAIKNGIFAGSFSPLLVEDALRTISSGVSIMQDSPFQKVMNTAGKNVNINIYVNYKNFPQVISAYIDPVFIPDVKSISAFADWMEIDMKIRTNSVSLNGFTYSNDSNNNYLNIFKNQKAQPIEVTNIIPSNTAILMHFGFSDFTQFQKDYITYLEKSNQLFDHGIAVGEQNIKYEIKIDKKLLSWVENEMALVITESPDGNYTPNSFAIFRTSSTELAEKNLNELVKRIAERNKITIDSTLYQEHIIKQIGIKNIISKLLGNSFSPIEQNYYTIIDKYVVFGNSVSSLKNFINRYLTKRTLAEDKNFKKFCENTSNESNIFVYSNIARSVNIYSAFANDEYAKDIEDNTALFHKFEAIAFQISRENEKLYYNNFFIKYNPVYKQETASLWEIKLDTTIAYAPVIIKNHKTDANEIMVQDVNNNLYLINQHGKIEWKYKLPSIIKSDIQQIDVFKNKKLQLIFNTDSAIYVLDRNGKKVEGFPIQLKNKITNKLAVFDYDKNRKYRLLVATSNNQIKMYNSKGKAVNGWEYKKSESAIYTPFKLLQVKHKDYIVGLQSNGKIIVLDRKGKQRIELKKILQLPLNHDFKIVKNNKIDECFIVSSDSIGNIKKVYFDDLLENINIKEYSNKHEFILHENKQGNRQFLIADKETLGVYNEDKKIIFKYKITHPISQLQVFPNKNSYFIGFNSSADEKIYLLNAEGTIINGFPLTGSTPFAIKDLDKDGSQNLIVGGKNGYLYNYVISE